MTPKTAFRIVIAFVFVVVIGTLVRGQSAPVGVIVSDATGGVGIHVLPQQGILFLMPSLPDGFLVCTEFANMGYQNCRAVKELRVKK